MSNTSETPIEYKSYSIQKDQRNPYGPVEFMYYPTEQGVDHDADFDGEQYKYTGNCAWAYTIEEAKIEIDARISEQGSRNPDPEGISVPMSITGNWKDLGILHWAIQNSIRDIDVNEYPKSVETLILWDKLVQQAIKDQKFDANALPFPEK